MPVEYQLSNPRQAVETWNGCVSKLKWPSRRQASGFKRVVLKQYADREAILREERNSLGVYRCRNCGSWHLGHSAGRRWEKDTC